MSRGTVDKPSDMSAAQSSVWDALAPLALAARTLTPATAFALQQLCKIIVLEQRMADEIDAKGLTTAALDTQMDPDGGGSQSIQEKAHPLLSRQAALLVRIEAGLTRFGLAPMGRPMAEPESPADEWAEFDQPLALVPKRA